MTASSQSSSQINLSWTDTSANETGFRIERRTTNESSFSIVALVGENARSFQDEELPALTQFFYRVVATNNAGDSAPSNEANATTGIPHAFVNGSFETPNVGSGYRYTSDGASWTFEGGAGISGNNSDFTSGNSPAPNGLQVAFLQQSGRMSQTASIPAGQYFLSFAAAQRLNYAIGTQTIDVTVDGTSLGQFQPGAEYSRFTTATFTLATSGNHTISLSGLATVDYTAFVDDIRVTAITATTVRVLATPRWLAPR